MKLRIFLFIALISIMGYLIYSLNDSSKELKRLKKDLDTVEIQTMSIQYHLDSLTAKISSMSPNGAYIIEPKERPFDKQEFKQDIIYKLQ
jgi:hypothetical protein